MKWSIKDVTAVLVTAAIAGLVTFLVRQHAIDRVVKQNQFLQRQLLQAQSDRQAALARAAARESELEATRLDSLELARLRQWMKTNSASTNLPTGFYIGADPPVYVSYGTDDPLLRSVIRALMNERNDSALKGQAIFQKTCAACHQLDGKGKDGVAPSLVGSEWVLDPGGARLVRIVLNGLTGPIAVQGRDWNLPMPPWRANLDDDAIAVVLNYIRSGLGTNKAAAIKPEIVSEARQESHPGPETSAELLQISAQ